MNKWFSRANEAGFFTVGERQNLKELMNTLSPTAQNTISTLCSAAYKLGQLADSEVKPNPDELPVETKKWLDTHTAEWRLAAIKDICVDWDGYRTAAGLGGLINEIWAYAAYPCNNKAHLLTLEELKHCTSETIWFESKADNKLEQLTQDGITALLFANILYNGISYNWKGFNINWRCWDKRPTVEQMKETSWDV